MSSANPKKTTDAELEELRNKIVQKREQKREAIEHEKAKISIERHSRKRSRVPSSSERLKSRESQSSRTSFMPRNLKIRRDERRDERRDDRRDDRREDRRDRGRDRIREKDRVRSYSRMRDSDAQVESRSRSRSKSRERKSDKADRKIVGGNNAVKELLKKQLDELKAKARASKKKVLGLEDGEINEVVPSDGEDSEHSAYATSPVNATSPERKGIIFDETSIESNSVLVERPNEDRIEPEIQEGEGEPVQAVEDEEVEEDAKDSSKKLKRVHIPAFMGSRTVQVYKRLNTIEEGTYGVVHRAQDQDTGKVVALKKIKMEKTSGSFPITSLREINILMAIDHPNIVKLKEIVIGEDLKSIYMVMEYLDHDMKMLLGQMKQPFRQSEVKTLMRQLLSAVDALHKGWILHRDLKTSNLLYSNNGVLKICDFGLARKYGSPIGRYTELVVTLWYRSPELLLGSKRYSEAVDMWSVGCIFAEFLTRKPLFPGRTEMAQIEKIFDLLGSPSKEQWPEFENLPHAKNFRWAKNKRSKLRAKFPKQNFGGGFYLDDMGFDLLTKLLAFDPKKRISAEEALNHEWFRTAPRPQVLSLMPTFPSANEKSRRKSSRKANLDGDEKGDQKKNGFFVP